MNRRSRIRHPVWFIWRREISVDSASFTERTLTMPGRERWVWGGEVAAEGEGGGGVCLPGAHSFHSLQNLWKCPLHTLGSSSAKLRRYVSGDKMPACRSIVGSETCNVIQRCWADKPATCKLVSYSDSWPWPCYKSLKETPHISLRWHSAEQLHKSARKKRQKQQFMQQKKLFIWDTHCQYKLRDHKTYTFQLFFLHRKQVFLNRN